MFHERISLIWVVLLLLLEFVIGSKLELMYKFLITNIRSSQTYICLFQLLVLQSLFTEITCFVCTNRINLVCKCFVSKGFLKLPNFLVLIKQESDFPDIGSRFFWRIAFNRSKSAIPPPFNGTEVLSSAS